MTLTFSVSLLNEIVGAFSWISYSKGPDPLITKEVIRTLNADVHSLSQIIIKNCVVAAIYIMVSVITVIILVSTSKKGI